MSNAPHGTGNIISIASVDDDLTIESRQRALAAVLERWALWQVEGKKFTRTDLLEGITVGGAPIKSFVTVRRWIDRYDWARQVYADFLGQSDDHIKFKLFNHIDTALDTIIDLARKDSPAPPADRLKASRMIFDLAREFDIFEQGKPPPTSKSLTILFGHFEGTTAYRPALPVDFVEGEARVIEED